MTTTAIYASRILTPQEEISDGVIIVEGSQITGVGHRDEIRVPADATDFVATGMTVVPGFVDLHIHGAGGHDVMEADARSLDRIASTVARHGTTSMLATTVTAPVDATCESLEEIGRYIRSREGKRPAASPPRYSEFTSKDLSSVPRGAECIRLRRSCRLRSKSSRNSSRHPTGS